MGQVPGLDLVEELQNRLDNDPELRAAFEALTPGRQRGYNYYFSTAKMAKTREARIDKYVAKILDGKGLRDPSGTSSKKDWSAKSAPGGKPRLLSGGNPQIAKADGDAPVQAYIAAMPGWKHDVGRELDKLIEKAVPDVRKAVRWNSPFYGVEGNGWFVSYHCITKYVKVSFFAGNMLEPEPPVTSRHEEVRYFHIFKNDKIDESLVMSWMKQAAALPGWNGF